MVLVQLRHEARYSNAIVEDAMSYDDWNPRQSPARLGRGGFQHKVVGKFSTGPHL